MDKPDKKQLYTRLGWIFFGLGMLSTWVTFSLIGMIVTGQLAMEPAQWPIPWVLRPLKLFTLSSMFFALGTRHTGISVPLPTFGFNFPFQYAYGALLSVLGVSAIPKRVYAMLALLAVACIYDL